MASNCVNYDAYFDRQVVAASTMLSVGIAMIQGARHEHGQAVQKAAEELGLEIEIIYLREQYDVSNELDCIILPGGESTTMRLVSTNHNVLPAIFDWIKRESRKESAWNLCRCYITLKSWRWHRAFHSNRNFKKCLGSAENVI